MAKNRDISHDTAPLKLDMFRVFLYLMIRGFDLVAVLICIFYYCNAHLIIFTCNLRTISIKLLLLLLTTDANKLGHQLREIF